MWPKPLTSEQIKRIAEKVNNGEIGLPDPDLPTDKDYVSVWASDDSGSSVHAVHSAKTFPGARTEALPKGAEPFTCANRSKIPNTGTAVVPFRTQEGMKSATLWDRAEVEMPILSTQELARNKRNVVYEEHGGDSIHPDGGPHTHVVAAHDVCSMKMLVPKIYTESPDKESVCGLARAEDEDELLVSPPCRAEWGVSV